MPMADCGIIRVARQNIVPDISREQGIIISHRFRKVHIKSGTKYCIATHILPPKRRLLYNYKLF